MRKYAAVAVLAVLGFSNQAGAQIVMGTGGATMPGGGVPMLGYYSPYPGTLYSPYRAAPVYNGYSSYASPFAGGHAFTQNYYAPNAYGNGFTVTRMPYSSNYSAYPRHGSPFPGQAYRRW